MSMDEAVRELGFSGEREFFRMTARIRMDTPERVRAFKRWQDEDGTKAGLISTFPDAEEFADLADQ